MCRNAKLRKKFETFRENRKTRFGLTTNGRVQAIRNNFVMYRVYTFDDCAALRADNYFSKRFDRADLFRSIISFIDSPNGRCESETFTHYVYDEREFTRDSDGAPYKLVNAEGNAR